MLESPEYNEWEIHNLQFYCQCVRLLYLFTLYQELVFEQTNQITRCLCF